jgi:hypothetical protein
MSYKVEHLSGGGYWYSEDMRFATADEAEAYAYDNPPYRITRSDEPANYRFQNSRLVPGTKDKFLADWETFAAGLV